MTQHRTMTIVDGNSAAASVAYRLSEVIAIYPITPSSTMGELSDEWAAEGKTNLWGVVPKVIEMQSEAGAAGAVHGALQAGALATTFTASQGLLLMIPNMYKIAGELTPFCMHVSARAVATHALSIFGDHSDVMACRQCGFAMLSSANVQEAQDFACIGHAATLAARVPFLHFFDGFRTSHELSKIEELSDEDLRAMVPESAVEAHRARALTPDHPVVRGTAQNPDTFFQAREACNGFYDHCPAIVQNTMNRFAELTGRQYRLFEYVGHPRATRVVAVMGSAAETVEDAVRHLTDAGERVGVVKVRLYRPFDVTAFMAAMPGTTTAIAVLDRTKEPGSVGEPLYQEVAAALRAAWPLSPGPLVIGGRFGLASKEFTPAMAKAVFAELAKARPRHGFTVGIVDDVTGLSLQYDEAFDHEPDDVQRAIFFGLGADGTVGANKNSIKIIGGESADRWVQGYFVYDSKKSGTVTVSHLRFGPRPIHAPYLISEAQFVACHQFVLLERQDVLARAARGATFLLNAPWPAGEVWDHLPREVQEQIIEKDVRLFVIDAHAVAREAGLGGRINTIMQTCFFALSGVIDRDRAIDQIKRSIEDTYGSKGAAAVAGNMAAVDMALARLHEVTIPDAATSAEHRPPAIPTDAPDFVQRVTKMMLAGKGDLLPVSAFPVDGTWPVATSQWERRQIAAEIPVWEPDLCIQCNKCVMACPHAAIRAGAYLPELLAAAPATFKATDYKAADMRGMKYTIQVAPDDCTGCRLCVEVCPAKDKTSPSHRAVNMAAAAPLRDVERDNFQFFRTLPPPDRRTIRLDVKGSQFLQPLFEFSGACAGCGETPYVKLLTQLFGDRAVIANATGCSSIYGGNLPTTPYCVNAEGRGPAWSNSLFEDNAEFGLGMRLALDQNREHARSLLRALADVVGLELVEQVVTAAQASEGDIAAQRQRVATLKQTLRAVDSPDARRLLPLCDYLVRKDVWIVGGDGWAYDIGFGGLDHVLASGVDVNVLVLDTEVYSNTGGQQSKATPLGAAAKFAAAGKETPEKDLARMAMLYGNVYVATVAFGAKDTQTVKAFLEAESYPGPSLIIAYSHCIAHGYDLVRGVDQQKLVVASGAWPLFRYDPRRREGGNNPLQLDSPAPSVPLEEYVRNEARFRVLEQQNPDHYRELLDRAQSHVQRHWNELHEMATRARHDTPTPTVTGAQ